ncbi:G-protein coupled receptor Mth2-like [Macrobrachium nipponense]|uniref:G-protein coupled receptor Mth2-like n=1 Tax=Macrobrachium nipponense TaxID=159736 RepID=UPI0030C82FF5
MFTMNPPVLKCLLLLTTTQAIIGTKAESDPAATLALGDDTGRIASELHQDEPTPVVLLQEPLTAEGPSGTLDLQTRLENMEANVTVPMCCGTRQVFNIEAMVCNPGFTRPEVTFHYEDGKQVEYKFAYNVKRGFPNCTFFHIQPAVEPDDIFYVLPDGKLKFGGSTLTDDRYCLLATEEYMEALVCFQEVQPQKAFFDRMLVKLYPVGLIISAIFLFATFVVYCLVEELRDLLGRCLMCNILALFIAQVSTVVVQMGTSVLSMSACIFKAVMMHFWYLSAFLWLNVICFNVFLTIWKKNDTSYGRTCRWFACYSAYAWGVAIFITSITLARDFVEGFQHSMIPKPNFGMARCWFSEDSALILFFYGPISVILGVNVILFIASAYKLCAMSTSSEARKFQFSLYLKLCVLMGITWIFEVISFFFQRHNGDSSSNYVWFVFDLINIMQGVIIFIVFVCRRAVLLRLCEVVFGKKYAQKKFPSYYQNSDADVPNEIKHSVI